jgi:long-chain acyl-CoA synthetase
MNFTAFLDVNARYFSEKIAVADPLGGRHYTYGEMLDEVNRVGKGLIELGLEKGDRVCIYLDSSLEFLISYFAIWRIGCIAVPADIGYKRDELLYRINDSGANTIITDGHESKIVADADIKNVIVVGDRGSKNQKLRAENCGFDDICHLQYTAGTTGKPKAAILTHGNWMSAVEAERSVLGLRADDIYLGFYPMSHVGVSWGITTLKYGGTFLIMRRFNLDDFLMLADGWKATVLSGMPPVIYALVHAPGGAEERIKTARVIISGGGPLSQKIWEEFDKRYAIPIANAYGLSETIVVGAGVSTVPNHMHLSKGYRSVGAPVGYSEVKIVDEEKPKIELPPYGMGEIALRGPGVAKGYWKKPKETESKFIEDGWFLTGDLGYLDEDNALYIVDRKKDVINMSGWKIYPKEVEDVLLSHPKIADAAIFGQEDEMRGEIPVAAIVLEANTKATKEEIISFCRERLAGYKVPRDVLFLDSLPRVHGWKLLRRVLREESALVKGTGF